MIYKEKEGQLKELKNVNFALERDLQIFIQRNMIAITGYKFIET